MPELLSLIFQVILRFTDGRQNVLNGAIYGNIGKETFYIKAAHEEIGVAVRNKILQIAHEFKRIFKTKLFGNEVLKKAVQSFSQVCRISIGHAEDRSVRGIRFPFQQH